jgi:hypothetical protein
VVRYYSRLCWRRSLKRTYVYTVDDLVLACDGRLHWTIIWVVHPVHVLQAEQCATVWSINGDISSSDPVARYIPPGCSSYADPDSACTAGIQISGEPATSIEVWFFVFVDEYWDGASVMLVFGDGNDVCNICGVVMRTSGLPVYPITTTPSRCMDMCIEAAFMNTCTVPVFRLDNFGFSHKR